MSDLSDAFLIRAQESLMGAESEFASGRYNNVANRAYYSCFQAAIAALDLAGIKPPGTTNEWSHSFVQSQFNGVLIGRRKRFPPSLQSTLPDGIALRHQADYGHLSVSRSRAARSLARSQQFVAEIMNVERNGR